ncbi:MAG: YHS domain-containing protein [candidate division Zixibacteria bacterium]|nr:YHS domain-containing protein [candidate division Zixibacteria bacterium]
MTTAMDLVCGMIVDEESAPAEADYQGIDYCSCATYFRETLERASLPL